MKKITCAAFAIAFSIAGHTSSLAQEIESGKKYGCVTEESKSVLLGTPKKPDSPINRVMTSRDAQNTSFSLYLAMCRIDGPLNITCAKGASNAVEFLIVDDAKDLFTGAYRKLPDNSYGDHASADSIWLYGSQVTHIDVWGPDPETDPSKLPYVYDSSVQSTRAKCFPIGDVPPNVGTP